MGTNQVVLEMYKRRLEELNLSFDKIKRELNLAEEIQNDIPKKDECIREVLRTLNGMKFCFTAVKDFMPFFDELCAEQDCRAIRIGAGYGEPQKPKVEPYSPPADWTCETTSSNAEHDCHCIRGKDSADGCENLLPKSGACTAVVCASMPPQYKICPFRGTGYIKCSEAMLKG